MANTEHLNILKKGFQHWNSWRNKNEVIPDLSGADLSEVNFSGVNFSGADLSGTDLLGVDLSGVNLSGANLSGADLSGADLSRASLSGANLSNSELSGAKLTNANLTGINLTEANLTGADFNRAIFIKTKLIDIDFSNNDLSEAILVGADLSYSNFSKANLTGANLTGANLIVANLYEAILFKANLSGANLSRASLNRADLLEADFSGANLTEANLSGASFLETNLSGSDLTNALLTGALCIQTNFENATIENARIYGISVWNIKSEGLVQKNLVITKGNEPVITVDNLEVAQFIYLILNNEKIRDVIGTIAKKGVLILGRFTPERKKILDAIREKLREHDFVPIMFDFEKVESRNYTETIKILAGMSRFVIADISDFSSTPIELQATVPDYKIPFIPIIQKGKKAFSMFVDLQQYDWVLPLIKYNSKDELLKDFKKEIIDTALAVDKRLFMEKQAQLRERNIGDL
ncbi:MAG: pentapeptide repeat-containing protein [Mariniphaga sp.]|nr:pentapeptide repeat-containing protein [Mariniphaga sp.]